MSDWREGVRKAVGKIRSFGGGDSQFITRYELKEALKAMLQGEDSSGFSASACKHFFWRTFCSDCGVELHKTPNHTVAVPKCSCGSTIDGHTCRVPEESDPIREVFDKYEHIDISMLTPEGVMGMLARYRQAVRQDKEDNGKD